MNQTNQPEQQLRREADQINQIKKRDYIKYMICQMDVRDRLEYDGGEEYYFNISFFNDCANDFMTMKNKSHWGGFLKKFKKKFKTLKTIDDLECEEFNNFVLSRIEQDKYKDYLRNHTTTIYLEIPNSIRYIKRMYYILFNYPNYKLYKNQLY